MNSTIRIVLLFKQKYIYIVTVRYPAKLQLNTVRIIITW